MPSVYVLLHLSNLTGTRPRTLARDATSPAQPTTVSDITWTPFTAIVTVGQKFVQVDVGVQSAEKRFLVEGGSKGAFLSRGEVERAMQTQVERVVMQIVRDKKTVRLEWGYAGI